MALKLVAIPVFVVLIPACGTTVLSKPDYAEVIAGKKSIVRTDNAPIFPALLSLGSTTLISVDGNMVHRDILAADDRVAVAIGEREFEVSCPSDHDSNSGLNGEFVNIEIEENHEYIILCGPKSGISVKQRSVKYGQP